MARKIYISLLVLTTMVIVSCKREKKDFIGPEVAIASNKFALTTPFSIQKATINFTNDSNWFSTTFNERVSWTITVRGVKSKAEKIIKGTSNEINISNSSWKGGHSGLNFFQANEDIISALTVFGKSEVWYDTSKITGVRKNFDPNVIVWWDMDANGVAKNNFNGVYWFDYYDGDASPPAVGSGERLMGRFEATTQTDEEPLQGIYRSMEGIELSVPVNYYIGGCSHSPAAIPLGFPNAPTNEVYLNFYARRRTTTSSISLTLTSINATDTSSVSYDTGTITWEGWKLVSVKLSDMKLNSTHPFDPGAIRQFAANLQTYTNTNVKTGFDIDFITFTKGKPFNPDNY